MSRGTQFPHGATVQELIDALNKVPWADRHKEVDVMFTRDSTIDYADGPIPGVITALDPFPEHVEDPQPTTVVWTIRSTEGQATAAAVESLSVFQEFLTETGRTPSPRSGDEMFDKVFSIAYDIALSDMKDHVRDWMVDVGWAKFNRDTGNYELTDLGLKQLEPDE